MEPSKKLDRILVRFFPPGIILEFKDYLGSIDTKSIDLLNLTEKYHHTHTFLNHFNIVQTYLTSFNK